MATAAALIWEPRLTAVAVHGGFYLVKEKRHLLLGIKSTALEERIFLLQLGEISAGLLEGLSKLALGFFVVLLVIITFLVSPGKLILCLL